MTIQKTPAIPTWWERELGRPLAYQQARSFSTAFQIHINQVFIPMISKLNMKYSNTKQREYKEVSRALHITDVSLCNWTKTKLASWIRVYITIRNGNQKKVNLTSCTTKTGKAFLWKNHWKNLFPCTHSTDGVQQDEFVCKFMVIALDSL